MVQKSICRADASAAADAARAVRVNFLQREMPEDEAQAVRKFALELVDGCGVTVAYMGIRNRRTEPT